MAHSSLSRVHFAREGFMERGVHGKGIAWAVQLKLLNGFKFSYHAVKFIIVDRRVQISTSV